ncbi:MAG: phosphoserine phosphatase SerB [Hyphomicrobiaceae bacterium]
MPTYALVLTSPPRSPSLSDLVAERALRQIPASQHVQNRWLAPREAWEAIFETGDPATAARIRSEVSFDLKGLTVDVNVVPADRSTRPARLLIADMESTIIVQECLDELADFVGLRQRISDITARAMRGDLDFEGAIKERVSLLQGLDAGSLDKVYDERVTLMPGAEQLVQTMKSHGAYCALVSGGFTFFTDKVAARLGFDWSQANRLEIAAGKITGRVLPPILGRAAKLEALERCCERLAIQRAAAMAVGDGANDLAMIKAAGCGVAFRAKPVVAAEAAATVRYGDLTALLYLQGYAKDMFAA